MGLPVVTLVPVVLWSLFINADAGDDVADAPFDAAAVVVVVENDVDEATAVL